MTKLSVDQVLLKAKSHIKRGDIDEAVKLYQTVLEAFPKNMRAQKGLAAVRKLKPDTLGQNPPKGVVNQVLNLFNQGQPNAVIELTQDLTLKYPNSFFIWNILGASHKSLGKIDDAEIAFRKVVELKPNYPDGYSNLGVILQEKGMLDDAILAFNKALSLKPDYAEAYFNKGIALKYKGKLKEAIEAHNKAIAIKPDYAEAYSVKGIALQEQGEFAEATLAFRKAIAIKPDYAEAHMNLGVCLKKQNAINEAIEVFEKVIALDSNHGTALHLLATLKGEVTRTAPRAYVENLFDDYANKFEDSLLNALKYNISEFSEVALQEEVSNSFGSVLDLGCGTGLLGIQIRSFSKRLVGVDLSSSMLDQAKKKNIYDDLIHIDLTDYLMSKDLDFDYFFAADVFVYVGDLSKVFELIKYRNKGHGKLVFSTEHREHGKFVLEKTGRYSHSKLYIEGLCDQYNYKILHFRKTNLRLDGKENSLVGGLYILEF